MASTSSLCTCRHSRDSDDLRALSTDRCFRTIPPTTRSTTKTAPETAHEIEETTTIWKNKRDARYDRNTNEWHQRQQWNIVAGNFHIS